MSYKFKILEPSIGLCSTCSYGTTIQGDKDRYTLVECNLIDKPIKFKVTKCTGYIEQGTVSLYDMRQIAWTLNTDKGGRVVGFSPPNKKNKLPVHIDPMDDDY